MQAWNDHYQSMHSAYSHAGHAPPVRESIGGGGSDTLTQPAMLNLKQFLDTQDENISDSEVMRKYTEYKTDFKRQQLNEFFVAHKDEEWLVAGQKWINDGFVDISACAGALRYLPFFCSPLITFYILSFSLQLIGFVR